MNSISKTLSKRKHIKNNLKIIQNESSYLKAQKMDVPKGLYEKCPSCDKTINMKKNIENDYFSEPRKKSINTDNLLFFSTGDCFGRTR